MFPIHNNGVVSEKWLLIPINFYEKPQFLHHESRLSTFSLLNHWSFLFQISDLFLIQIIDPVPAIMAKSKGIRLVDAHNVSVKIIVTTSALGPMKEVSLLSPTEDVWVLVIPQIVTMPQNLAPLIVGQWTFQVLRTFTPFLHLLQSQTSKQNSLQPNSSWTWNVPRSPTTTS